MIRTAARSCSRAVMLLVLALPGAVLAQSGEAPDVRRLMSPEEFRDAGLERLSPAEIEALNAWVLRYTASDAVVLRRSNSSVREEIRNAEAAVIRSRIVGEFRGWNGDTVFRLQNGQTWQQRIGGRWFHRATDPEVEVRRNMLGYWELRVVDADRSVGVKPLH